MHPENPPGAWYVVSPGETLDQILFMRPVYGFAGYRTPVRGLYLCGAGAHPGGGIAGGAGANAAKAVLADKTVQALHTSTT